MKQAYCPGGKTAPKTKEGQSQLATAGLVAAGTREPRRLSSSCRTDNLISFLFPALTVPTTSLTLLALLVVRGLQSSVPTVKLSVGVGGRKSPPALTMKGLIVMVA